MCDEEYEMVVQCYDFTGPMLYKRKRWIKVYKKEDVIDDCGRRDVG